MTQLVIKSSESLKDTNHFGLKNEPKSKISNMDSINSKQHIQSQKQN